MDAASLTLGRRDKGWVVGAGLLLDRAGQVEAGLPLRQSTSGIRRLPQRSLVFPCSVAEESTIRRKDRPSLVAVAVFGESKRWRYWQWRPADVYLFRV